MKNFKFLYLLLAAVGVVTFTSCVEEWTPGAQDKGAGVFFLDTSVINVAEDTESVDIVVKRTNVSGAVDISVRAAEADFCTVPNSVSFADGSDTATLTVAVDASKMELGKKYSVLIQLDSAAASTYGTSEYNFVFMIPEKWVDFLDEKGKVIPGIYIDDFFPILLEYDAGYWFSAHIQKHELNPNRFRVVDPFGKQFWKELAGDLPGYVTVEEASFEFDVSDPENVVLEVNPVSVGVTINFSDGPAAMYLWVETDENGNQVPGAITYKDGVIQFAANKVYMCYPEGEQLKVLTPVNASGLMAYALPGVELTDYAMAAEYAGMKIETDNQTASAIINFGYGADVESFKFTVVDGTIDDAAAIVKDPTAIVEAIVAGSEEYTIYDGTVDTFEYTVPVGETGVKTLVAVPYGGGEARTGDALVYPFYFAGAGANEIPDVEIQVVVDSVVGVTGNPEYEASYPSDSTMCIYMAAANAVEIRSIEAFVAKDVPAEVTPEEIFAEGGEDFSDYIAEIDEYGYALALYTGLTPGTTYDVFLSFTTIYGQTKYFRTQYIPTAASTPEQTAVRLNVAPKQLNVRDFTPVAFR